MDKTIQTKRGRDSKTRDIDREIETNDRQKDRDERYRQKEKSYAGASTPWTRRDRIEGRQEKRLMKEREIEPDKDEMDYLKKALKFFIDSSIICWSSTALDQKRPEQ